jgi:hypothetical protein
MADKKDRELGLSMLRILKIRDSYYESRDVYCTCNYHIGQPVMQSVWADELIIPNEVTAEGSTGKTLQGVNRRRGIGKRK